MVPSGMVTSFLKAARLQGMIEVGAGVTYCVGVATMLVAAGSGTNVSSGTGVDGRLFPCKERSAILVSITDILSRINALESFF